MRHNLVHILFHFCLFSCLAQSGVLAGEGEVPQRAVVQEKIAELDITEWVLPNGMKVCLKSQPSNDSDLAIQLFAVGGFAAFPEEEQPSARLASSMVLASGLGRLTGKEVSSLIMGNAIDLALSIAPHQRSIEATSSSEHLEILLGLLRSIFVEPQLDEASAAKILAQSRESVLSHQADCHALFKDLTLSINTHGLKVYQPLTLDDLQKVNLKMASDTFRQAFGQPSDFTCVVVGHLPETTLLLLERYLGTIPSVAQERLIAKDVPEDPVFPPGTSTHYLRCGQGAESLTRLTFPISIPFTFENMQSLELCCQVVETRLRETIRRQKGTTQAADVGYELPAYPFTSRCWMTVEFHSSEASVPQLIALCLKGIEQLIAEGPTETELKNVKLLLRRAEEFWATDNNYWAKVLSNYYKWGWDARSLLRIDESMDSFSKVKVKQALSTMLSPNTYTVVILSPT